MKNKSCKPSTHKPKNRPCNETDKAFCIDSVVGLASFLRRHPYTPHAIQKFSRNLPSPRPCKEKVSFAFFHKFHHPKISYIPMQKRLKSTHEAQPKLIVLYYTGQPKLIVLYYYFYRKNTGQPKLIVLYYTGQLKLKVLYF